MRKGYSFFRIIDAVLKMPFLPEALYIKGKLLEKKKKKKKENKPFLSPLSLMVILKITVLKMKLISGNKRPTV